MNAMYIRQIIKPLLIAGMLAIGLAGSIVAHASVILGGTRVILDGKEGEATIKASNEGDKPALIQAWVDKGNAKAAPASIDVPFTAMPPVARIEPGKGQTLRILYTGESLPKDKESVFWLNVLEVPPKSTGELADANQLQLAFRTRIKLFYRPAGLKGSPVDAPAGITWRIKPSAKTLAIEASNPTAYHVSFSSIEISADGKTVHNQEGGMVAPGETKEFLLDGVIGISASAKVRYRSINDWGGVVENDAPIAPAN